MSDVTFDVLTPAEVAELRQEMELAAYVGPRFGELVCTVLSREGTLRRLYNAVLATPLEGEELRAAMRETERVLGIDP